MTKIMNQGPLSYPDDTETAAIPGLPSLLIDLTWGLPLGCQKTDGVELWKLCKIVQKYLISTQKYEKQAKVFTMLKQFKK